MDEQNLLSYIDQQPEHIRQNLKDRMDLNDNDIRKSRSRTNSIGTRKSAILEK